MAKCETCEANKQGVTITKEIVDGLMETVRNLYLADDIPWVIGYSGGKDSTATLQLVWLSLLALPKEKRKKNRYDGRITCYRKVGNKIISYHGGISQKR